MINRPTTAADISAVLAQAKEIFGAEGDLHSRMLQSLGLGCAMCTLEKDGDILCVVSASYMWEGVVEISSVFTTNAHKHKVALGRYLKRYLNECIKKLDAHRYQITVREDFNEAKSFASFLGFEQEAVLYKYGVDKTNYIMYRKVL
jgi:hypothetical protein